MSTHTHVLTQSMLVEGVGVKREKTGGIQIALTWGEKRHRGHLSLFWIPQVASEQEVGARKREGRHTKERAKHV